MGTICFLSRVCVASTGLIVDFTMSNKAASNTGQPLTTSQRLLFLGGFSAVRDRCTPCCDGYLALYFLIESAVSLNFDVHNGGKDIHYHHHHHQMASWSFVFKKRKKSKVAGFVDTRVPMCVSHLCDPLERCVVIPYDGLGSAEPN